MIAFRRPSSCWLVALHGRAAIASRGARRTVSFYEKGLLRLDDAWAGSGESGERFGDEGHPYAADLDLFGAGSLYERLCLARTEEGQARLANWLLGPAPPDVIREAKYAGRPSPNWRPRLDFREDLASLGGDVRGRVDSSTLVGWASEAVPTGSKGLARTADGLALAALASLVGWAALGTGPWPFVAVVVGELVFFAAVSRRVGRALDGLEDRTTDLVVLAELLARIERESFGSPLLMAIRDPPRIGRPAAFEPDRRAGPPDRADRGPAQRLSPPDPRRLPLDDPRRLPGRDLAGGPRPGVARWIEAVGEVEALASLAAYAAENPDDPFPEVVEGPARFEAVEVGHPLLPRASCVRNSLSLGDRPGVLVVSGSNMSGKSTLLRTVGVNTVLALAGAPVRAGRLTLTPLAVGATLRIQDSLQAGRSRFYAELLRVRRLVEIASAGGPPLLFLLDEIFHGTNSADRTRGAEGVVRALIDRGAIGLVSTHDLALAGVADRLAPRAANVHFEDRMVDGELVFDYAMRPGVVSRSNALELMRAVGLEV